MAISPRIEKVKLDHILLHCDYNPSAEYVRELSKDAIHEMPIIKDDGTILTGEFKIWSYKQWYHEEIECVIYPSDLKPERYDLIIAFDKFKKDQTWQARIKLELEIHNLLQLIHGAGKRGRGYTGWGIKDTAVQLNISIGKLNEDINLAKAFLIDPELEKISTRDKAKKVYDKVFKQAISDLSEPIIQTIEPDRALYGKPALILRNLPDACFHVAILEVDLNVDEWLADLFGQVYDKLIEDSFFYIFCDIDNFSSYKNLLQARNFKVQDFPVIYSLLRDDMTSKLPWQYNLNYESIIVAIKGDPVLLDGMIHYASITASNKKDIIKNLLNHSTQPGSLILGSMFIIQACISSDRHFITLENDKNKYVHECIKNKIDPHKDMTYKFT